MPGSFWKNKNVLVTGGRGFVGSHLSRRLIGLGAKVVVIERPLDKKFWESAEAILLNKNIILVKGDLRDLGLLKKVCESENIDTIFHLAASAIVSQAAKNPLLTLENNFLTTVNILEAARQFEIRRVIIASSDKSYGDHSQDSLQPLPYRETYTLRGLDMYSVSKATSDVVAQAYALQFKMPVATLRFGNIYGPGDLNFTRLIPRNSLLLLSGQRPTIKSGHEKVLREYLYIDDAVEAYLIVAEKIEEYCGEYGEKLPQRGPELYGWTAFNVGSYSTRELKDITLCSNIASVSSIIGYLCSFIKDLEPVITRQPQEYVEIPDEYLDAGKIKKLGFFSKIGLQEGLNKTTKWYGENYKFIKPLFVEDVLK
jgi:CDP-glucose 4,6-dehydratase